MRIGLKYYHGAHFLFFFRQTLMFDISAIIISTTCRYSLYAYLKNKSWQYSYLYGNRMFTNV